MPFTKFANLDFDQIRTSIKDYLRSNSNFTDFDFEGSNFSVLIDTLAYNTYITSFNANMVANESFLDSATLRENVVSLARNIGYVPRSKTSASAVVSFSVPANNYKTLTLQSGLVCKGTTKGSSYQFSVPENITSTVENNIASFENITINEGTFLKAEFTVNNSTNQKFILDNSFIDTSTIRVYVKGISDTGIGKQYKLVDNIFEIDKNSEIFLIQEIVDEKYEILFGDGIFGKKLENDSIVTVTYIVSDGKNGNDVSEFAFAGSFKGDDGTIVSLLNGVQITTIEKSNNGSDIESIESIRSYAPRLYSSQYRAVTGRDYETIIKSKIYPKAEAISVVGGEELDPPQYGKVIISIKPQNGTFVSDFDKEQIKNKLRQYSIAGINPEIMDLKILYVEIDSAIYYNYSKVDSPNNLKTSIISSLNEYSKSIYLNSFSGRFKYSKVLQVIDSTDSAITSNITKVRIRRDLKVNISSPTQYEICFGNRFYANSKGKNIKSTGFNIFGVSDLVYLTDVPNSDLKSGIISVVKENTSPNSSGEKSEPTIVIQSAGSVNYETGEIMLGVLNITSTVLTNNIIEIQAFPESNDVIGLKDLYLSFDVSKSRINMVKDVIESGDDSSGTLFSGSEYYTSSYSNGELKRS